MNSKLKKLFLGSPPARIFRGAESLFRQNARIHHHKYLITLRFAIMNHDKLFSRRESHRQNWRVVRTAGPVRSQAVLAAALSQDKITKNHHSRLIGKQTDFHVSSTLIDTSTRYEAVFVSRRRDSDSAMNRL
jgi:hypothetical protein